MKNLKISASLLVMIFIIASCGVTENGFGSSIQKRKYTKGFYFNKNKSHKVSNNDVFSDSKVGKETEELAETTIENGSTQPTANKSVIFEQESVAVQTPSSDKQEGSQTTTPKKKATVQKKEPKPTAPRQRKLREHQYYIPLQDNVVADHQFTAAGGADSTLMLILLIVLAIIIPPLAVALFEGITKRFWIDLILAIVGLGIGFFFLTGGLVWLCALAAIIYALLIVLEVI